MMIRDKITDPSIALTRSERRIVQMLMANYPTAGLGNVMTVAEKANVSVPTVLRFCSKLGFTHYAAFQSALIEELQESLHSPLLMFERQANTADEPDGHICQSGLRRMANILLAASDAADPTQFDAIVELLSDSRRPVVCAGGRSSGLVAQRLAHLLTFIRPGVSVVSSSGAVPDSVVDFDRRTILVVFDFRRYQEETFLFARMARKRGATIVLFTDRWLSPVHQICDHAMISAVEGFGPFDSRVVAFTQCEMLVAALTQRLPDQVRTRLNEIESMREGLRGAVSETVGPAPKRPK